MMRTKPRYIFCWWCSRQLWGKRSHVRMQRADSRADTSVAIVHRACSDQMMRDGEWQTVEDAA